MEVLVNSGLTVLVDLGAVLLVDLNGTFCTKLLVSILSTCLGAAFMRTSALAFNFYFINIFMLNFIHYFQLKHIFNTICSITCTLRQ